MGYTGLDSIHRASTGAVAPASWGDAVNDDTAFLYGDAAWTNITSFTNSWSASGSAPGYILSGRIVYLRGSMLGGTASSAAFTLPAGYRPTMTSWFLVSNNGTITSTAVQILA